MTTPTTSPVWGGTHVTNPSHHILAKNFQEFLEHHIDNPLRHQMTRKQFDELPEERRKEIKMSGFFIPCTLEKEGDSRKNPTGISLICIDVDDAPSLPAEAELRDLLPWNFAAYTTISSTPEKPRYRLVVDAAGLPMDLYTTAVTLIGRMIGLPENWDGKVESCKKSQPMFFPVSFLGETDEDSASVISSVFAVKAKGKTFTVKDFPAEDAQDFTTPSDDFGDCSSQIPNITLDHVEEMLDSIPAGCGRREWIKVMCGLKHQFRAKDEAQLAFELFNQWSATGANYAGRADVEKQWKCSKPTASGASTTIRTVMQMAQTGGWTQDKLSVDLEESFLAWLKGAERNEISTKAAIKIAELHFAGIPLLMENSLKGEVVKVFKKLGGNLTLNEFKGACREAIEKLRIDRSAGEIPVWLRQYVWVKDLGFVSKLTGSENKPENFDTKHGDDMKQAFGMRHDYTDNVRASDYAKNVSKIPYADLLTYDPRRASGDIYNCDLNNGQLALNTYKPAKVVPDARLSQQAGDDFRRHMEILAGNEPQNAETAIKFFAHLIQNPGVKILWMLVLHSNEGLGKTTLSKLMAALLGLGNCKISSGVNRSEKFNSWQTGCILSSLEELTCENVGSITQGLKEFITNDVILLRRMRMDPYPVVNVTNAMAFTNEMGVLPVDEGSRRYFVLSSPKTKEDVIAMRDAGYFTNLLSWMQPDKVGGLYHFLQNYDLSGFDPTASPPVTRAFTDMRLASMTPGEKAVMNLTEDPSFPWAWPDVIAEKQLSEHLSSNRYRIKTGSSSAEKLGFVFLKSADGEKAFFQLANTQTAVMVKNGGKLTAAAAHKLLEDRLTRWQNDLSNDFDEPAAETPIDPEDL